MRYAYLILYLMVCCLIYHSISKKISLKVKQPISNKENKKYLNNKLQLSGGFSTGTNTESYDNDNNDSRSNHLTNETWVEFIIDNQDSFINNSNVYNINGVYKLTGMYIYIYVTEIIK